MAVAIYRDIHGSYPPAYVLGPDGRPWHSWRVLILPYLGENELYQAYDFSEPWDGPKNRDLASRMPKIYGFHSTYRPGETITNYVAVVGEGTVWPGPVGVKSSEITDKSEETILIVENYGAGIPWMEPRDLTLAEIDLGINNPSGISSPYKDPAVVMVDGSVQRLRLHLQPQVLHALFTIRGNEKLLNGHEGWEWLPDGRQRPLQEDDLKDPNNP